MRQLTYIHGHGRNHNPVSIFLMTRKQRNWCIQHRLHDALGFVQKRKGLNLTHSTRHLVLQTTTVKVIVEFL